MRILFSSAALAILCSGCVETPPPPPPLPPVAASDVTNFQTKVSETDPKCHDYTGQATIDGKQEQVIGHACLQPDGSWKVAEGTAEQPNQYVAVYPAPIYYADGQYYPGYAYDWPWLWDASFGFGTSFVFFDHHFHHHGFHHGGFHHEGFGHGGVGHMGGGGFHHR